MNNPQVANSPAPGGAPDGAARARQVRLIGWIATAAAIACGIILPLSGTFASLFVFACALVLAFAQGVYRYGLKLLAAFFVIAFVISNFFENLSIWTGFPFGNYHYTLGGKLLEVPIMIGIIYFGLGYVSWMTASVVLDRADERLDTRTAAGRLNVVMLPVLAGAVMTMYDVGSDSIASTIAGTWIWEDGGGVFGVPYTNYLGWWFVTYSFFQVFAVVLARRQSRETADRPLVLRSVSLVQPVLIYLMTGVSTVAYFFGADVAPTAKDGAGVAWSTEPILETMLVINIFSVFILAMVALVKLRRSAIASDA